jgi:hypothetical protein
MDSELPIDGLKVQLKQLSTKPVLTKTRRPHKHPKTKLDAMNISKIANIHKAIVRGWNTTVGPYINLIAYIYIPETALAYLTHGWLRAGSVVMSVLTYVLVLGICRHFGRKQRLKNQRR